MKTVWITFADGGLITSAVTNEEYSAGMKPIEVDDSFELESISDYRVVDGELTYTGEATAAREEAEEQAKAEAERKRAIDERCQAFFIDGGKTKMEQDIEDAAASGGGADPQLKALATLQIATMDLTSVTSTECAAFRDYWPEWKPDTQYKQNDPLQWKGVYYRVSQDTTSSSVYPPDTAGESLYYPVTIAPDVIIVYRTCHGAYDMVRAGETRHYPDADGPVYRAKVDTAYDPDTMPANWELVPDAGTE